MERKSSRRTFALTCAGSLLAWPTLHAQTTERIDTVMALLDRIDRLAAAARKDLDVDNSTAKVEISAADLDEIRAEVAQIKLLLKPSAT